MKKIQNLKMKIATFTAITVGTLSANAALPTDAQAAVDGIGTFANDMIAWAWPVVTTVVLASIGIKLFKRFSGKAT
ncbi:MAG: major coat protein [Thalassolituus sp.]|jgi:hypothetical protein